MFISQQTLTFLWNFTTYVQLIVTDICKVLRYRTSLMVLFSSSTLSSTSSRTSQRTECVSVIKINNDRVSSYMYIGLPVSILLVVPDYSGDRNIGTNSDKYSKHEIQPQWIRRVSCFFVRANRQTDMTRLMVTFRSFVGKAPKKRKYSPLTKCTFFPHILWGLQLSK